MNELPLHPVLVHLPLGLAALMPLATLGLLAAWMTGKLPRRAFVLAAALQLTQLVSGVVALRSGEAEEERVEASAPEAAVEAHEHAAQRFVLATAAVAAALFGVLALKDERAARGLAGLSVLGTVGVLGLAVQTGHQGGELVYVHGVGRMSAAQAPGTAAAGEPGAGAEASDDD